MCHLDESWTLTYFQVAVSILIFGIGIPSLVIQFVIPEDLRRIVHDHWRLIKWGFLLILLFMLFALAFIWVIHPCGSQPLILLTPLGMVLDKLFARIGLNIGQWIAGVIITIDIAAVGAVWYLFTIYRSDGILNLLEQKCLRQIRQTGAPDDKIIEDIKYLGEQRKTGRDKARVIGVLGALAEKVQAHSLYEGNGLEDIIAAIEFILRKDPDYHSFGTGIRTLRCIVENLQAPRFISPGDMGLVLRALRRLGEITYTMDNIRPALLVLGTIRFVSNGKNGAFSDASLSFLEIGAIALNNKSFLVARGALSRLEAMMWPKQPLDAETSAAYLGLLAHFWVLKDSARRHALSSLEGVDFSPSREQCLIDAQEIHYKATRFETADNLSRWVSGRE
jgi:hypothetical protein